MSNVTLSQAQSQVQNLDALKSIEQIREEANEREEAFHISRKAALAKELVAKAAKKAEATTRKVAKKATKAAPVAPVVQVVAVAASAAPVVETRPTSAAVQDVEETLEVPETLCTAMAVLALDSALTPTQAYEEFFRLVTDVQQAGEIKRSAADALVQKFYDEVCEIKAAQSKKDWPGLAAIMDLSVKQVVVSANVLDSTVSAEDAVQEIRAYAMAELNTGRFTEDEMAWRMATVSAMMPKVKAAVAARDYVAVADLMEGRAQPEASVERQADVDLPSNVTVDITEDTVTYTVDLGTTSSAPAPDTAMAAAMQRANAPKGNARKGNAPKGK